MSINLHAALKHTFGFDQFREGQEKSISQLLNGQSTLSIFPTGSGKSLCYQLAALHLPHLTLLVSPLLALMKDQLDFLASKGIDAASIDSTHSPEENHQIMARVRSGEIKILMVSVERFKNERFRHFIDSVNVSMLVIDEAHCISEWGHNFRPDYLKLPDYRKALNIPLVLLLTATATKKVKLDMAKRFDILPECIIQTGFYRANLDLSVVAVTQQQKNQQLLALIHSTSPSLTQGGENNSGIVYVTLQHCAEVVAEYLQHQGINACAYHAGFDTEKRQHIQQNFMSGNINVVVATIAFGMGIDKNNIRFVIHYDLPKSIENYSQEIGRAGRDGALSQCFTLANLDGLNTVENFVYGDTPECEGIQQVLDNIKEETDNGQWELQLLSLANASNIRQLPMKTLLVQLELMGYIKPKYVYYGEVKVKFLQPQNEILNHFSGERREFLQAVFAHMNMKKVWATMNFEAFIKNHSSDRARVITALDYLQEQQLITLETTRLTEVYSVNQIALSTPLASGLSIAQTLFQYFKNNEIKEVKRIAALVRFFELEHCLSSNLSRYFDDQNAPERCGHCSVCRGQVAKLNYSNTVTLPDDSELLSYLTALKHHIAQKSQHEISMNSYCRFLVGMSVPMFTRFKVRQLAGFGCCESIRYSYVLARVEALMNGR
jgi:ATP-dependent DNA helicase RecQ